LSEGDELSGVEGTNWDTQKEGGGVVPGVNVCKHEAFPVVRERLR
jgi:hypothetical protein